MRRLILQTQYARFPVSHAPVSKLSIPRSFSSIYYYRSIRYLNTKITRYDTDIMIVIHEINIFLLLNCYICIFKFLELCMIRFILHYEFISRD